MIGTIIKLEMIDPHKSFASNGIREQKIPPCSVEEK
jgi:hypothetical protein